jgi:small subunit ribosomal protein S2
VIDTNKEALAIAEARKLRIPVVAVLDTNSDPDGVDYPIPGNDDASRAIALYTDLAARAVIAGMTSQLGAAGFDLGELEDAPVEEALAAEPVVEVEAPAEVAVEAAVEAAPEAPAEVAVEASAEVAAEEAPVEAVAEAPAEEAAAEEAVAEEPKKAAPKKAAPKKAAAKTPKKAPKKAPAKADAEEAPAEPAAEDEAAAS